MFATLCTLATLYAASPVTFTLGVHQDAFLAGQPVTVTILDSEQLRRAEENADCVTWRDASGETGTTCRDGAPPLEIAPETFTIDHADLGRPITIRSSTVAPGERYQISVGGTAVDGCNTAGGSQEGRATRAVSADLELWATEMACLRDE